MQRYYPLNLDVDDAKSGRQSKAITASLVRLPTELQLLVTRNLTYPDALSLKHTNRHFYDIVYTGVNLKIEWLIERRRLDLDRPHDKKCELDSDLRFCKGIVRYAMMILLRLVLALKNG